MPIGHVTTWDGEAGLGVVGSDATPGGCWFHFSVVAPSLLPAIAGGMRVEFTYEQPGQDGSAYRATSVRRPGSNEGGAMNEFNPTAFSTNSSIDWD